MTDASRLYIVVRADLRMGRGKEIAQAIHAFRFMEPVAAGQLRPSSPIICVRAADEAALREIIAEAVRRADFVSTVHDAGLTHNEPGTLTCVAIGPLSGESGSLLAAAKLY